MNVMMISEEWEFSGVGEDMEQSDRDFPVCSRLKCVSLAGLRR
jgi:hypothetical protein